MKKLNWSNVRNFFCVNKGLLALSVGIGGIASIVAAYVFKITFINESAYNHVVSLFGDGLTIDKFLFTDGVKWVMLVSIISLLLVPLLCHGTKQIIVFVLLLFTVLDGVLALLMFINQTIGNLEFTFVSISFTYYVFTLILCLKSLYRWLQSYL